MNNIYFLLRHGQAMSNIKKIVSFWPEKIHNPLTDKGKKQIQKLIPELKKENIDLIFSSDLLRTKQTAGIIADSLDLKIKFDKRLREIEFKGFNGGNLKELEDFLQNKKEKFTKESLKTESYKHLRTRVKEFVNYIEKKYKNKKILIISHGANLLIFQAVKEKLSPDETIKHKSRLLLKTGELRILLR